MLLCSKHSIRLGLAFKTVTAACGRRLYAPKRTLLNPWQRERHGAKRQLACRASRGLRCLVRAMPNATNRAWSY
jgi:hypothetical protein